MDRRYGIAGLGLLGVVGAGVALAQAPVAAAKPAQAPGDTAIVDFQSRVGSFKIVSPSPDVKARGKVTMNFQGTILIVGLEGNVVPAGGVKVQYDDAKHGRKAYFGRGSLTIDGKWRAIQFFGRDFKGTWDGMGIMRLYGEFDDKLDTGTYQIRGFGTKEAWGNGGRQVILPPATSAATVKPKIEDVKPGRRPG